MIAPFVVETLEASACGKKRLLEPRNGNFKIFRVDEPFILRKAVVPLLWFEEDRSLTGLGTAFSLDPWGGLVSADHVVADARVRFNALREGDRSVSYQIDGEQGFAALLGPGLALGTGSIPKGALNHITEIISPALQGDDPLATLRGNLDLRPIDLACMRFDPTGRNEVHNLPLSLKPPVPAIGDTVVALGYPGLRVENRPSARVDAVILEGLTAAYGVITDVFPNGRDKSNPTPVFQVDGYWPSGMSGGPVINANGEVIGVVSRSIITNEKTYSGTGWATMLSNVQGLGYWMPSLAHEGPQFRSGWTVLQDIASAPIYYRLEEEASAAARSMGANARVCRAEYKVGGIESVIYEKW